jgi:hypothetical protein
MPWLGRKWSGSKPMEHTLFSRFVHGLDRRQRGCGARLFTLQDAGRARL